MNREIGDRVPVKWKDCLIAFFIYLSIGPIVGGVFGKSASDIVWRGWINALTLLISAIVLAGFALYLTKSRHMSFFFSQKNSRWRELRGHLGYGILVGLMVYPIVISFNFFAQYVVQLFTDRIPIDQEAVRYIRDLIPYPFLHSVTVGLIVVIVPWIEEFLFRGLLQNAFKNTFGTAWGIVFASVFFAVFHLHPAQGWGNINIVVAIFILSIALGSVYERRRSLIGCMALHGTFNALTLLLI